MATLTNERTQQNIGVHNEKYSGAGNNPEASLLTPFASASQVWADRYADYKYNQTDWRAIRP